MNKKRDLKKEFEEFSRKVATLRLLKEELDTLDTERFEGEAAAIRHELKNVDAIPDIKQRLGELRKKIAIKEAQKQNAASMNNSLPPDSLRKKISEIEKIIKIKKKSSPKKQLTREEVTNVKEIPALESQLSGLKSLIAEHDKKTMQYGGGIEKLDAEIRNLRRTLEKSPLAMNVPVDDRVETAVDNGFKNFLDSLKNKLSNEVETRKKSALKNISRNISLQKKEFSRKYNELAREMRKNYEEKVRKELKKEVEKRFNNELQKKISLERKKISADISRRKAGELEEEKKEMLGRLESFYGKREMELQEMAEKEIEEEKFLREEKESQKIKNIELEKKRRTLSEKEMKLQEKVGMAEKEGKSLINEEMREIERQKLQLKEEIEKRVAEEQKNLKSQLNELRKSLEEDYKRKLREARENEKREKKSLLEREKKFRKELELQYEQKLSAAIKSGKEKIENQSREFEQHVSEQSEKLFSKP